MTSRAVSSDEHMAAAAASGKATTTSAARGRRKILVAVDGEEESNHALQWFLKNVASKSSTTTSADAGDVVVALYCMPHLPVLAPMADGTGYVLSKEMVNGMRASDEEVADEVLSAAADICRAYPNVNLKMMVERGDAGEVICEMINELNCDMLVMGSHGYNPFHRTFLGSVSEYCAHHAECPVLIVKK